MKRKFKICKCLLTFTQMTTLSHRIRCSDESTHLRQDENRKSSDFMRVKN